MKICSKCEVPKPFSLFSKNKARKDGYQSTCKDCRKEEQAVSYLRYQDRIREKTKLDKKLLRLENQAKMKDYLSDKFCKDCDCDDWRVLEFDHLSDKKYTIGSEYGNLKWENILQEISKCEIVCANCHKIRTMTRNGSYRSVV